MAASSILRIAQAMAIAGLLPLFKSALARW
jgi:hypothetical protein